MGIFGVLSLILSILRLFISLPPKTSSFVTVYELIHGTLSILILSLLIRRKRAFKAFSMLYFGLAFLYGIYFDIGFPLKRVTFVADIVYCVLYVLSVIYIVRSKRVRTTFVR